MSENKRKLTNKIQIKKADIIIFLIVFIFFTVTLLSFFPGLLTSDGVDQIEQAKNNSYVDAHPIFHSFLMGNLVKMGGIWVPALFQILLFAFIWTYICKIIRKYNNSGKNVVFQILFTIFISILPLNFIYSIVLWKDILYSYAIVLSLIFIYIGIKEKFKYTTAQSILLAVSNALIMKLRHNGAPIGFIMFTILFVLNLIYNKKFKQSLALIIPFITALIIMTIPKWIWQNNNSGLSVGGAFDGAKVYCIGAFLNEDIEFEESEIEFLNKILNVEKWKECYNPYSGTEILFNEDYNSDVLKDKESNKIFNEIFMKYAITNKKVVLNHLINVNSIWWSIPEKAPMHSIILSNGYLKERTNGVYENNPKLLKMNNFLINYSIITLDNNIIYTLIYRPAIAILISIVVIIVISIKRRNIKYLIILFPMIMNIGTYILLISSQDQRYFYPCFMTEYVSILILAECIITNRKKEPKKNNIKTNLKDPKTLIIIPAYNESQSIKNVVNSVYSEKIPNCDVIVINDGSNDNTYEEAKKTKAVVIDVPNNLGIGGAVQTGYLYAKKNGYDIAIQIDGDGQHDPKYVIDLIQEIKNGNDLVIGSRFVQKTKYEQTLLRMLGIKVISFTIYLISKIKIYDTTSGFRAVNKNIIEEFAESYPYDYPEPCTNMSILQKGYKVKEIPVEMKHRETGVSSISPVKAVIYMFKVILSILLMGIKK